MSGVASPVTTNHAARESVFVNLRNAGNLKNWPHWCRQLHEEQQKPSPARSSPARSLGHTGYEVQRRAEGDKGYEVERRTEGHASYEDTGRGGAEVDAEREQLARAVQVLAYFVF